MQAPDGAPVRPIRNVAFPPRVSTTPCASTFPEAIKPPDVVMGPITFILLQNVVVEFKSTVRIGPLIELFRTTASPLLAVNAPPQFTVLSAPIVVKLPAPAPFIPAPAAIKTWVG